MIYRVCKVELELSWNAYHEGKDSAIFQLWMEKGMNDWGAYEEFRDFEEALEYFENVKNEIVNGHPIHYECYRSYYRIKCVYIDVVTESDEEEENWFGEFDRCHRAFIPKYDPDK